MKAIRRSIKGEKSEPRSTHISSISQKSAIAIQPPKKVIKALYDYDPDPNNPNELGFHKGDFFHVISRENDQDWYEACNPLIPHARGLVPVSYFEIIGKNERQSTGSNASATGDKTISIATPSTLGGHASAQFRSPGPGHARNSSIGKGNMVYGIVMYDFNAERPDELDAKAGEAIIVIAQSNPEWFVAKPIGRLGGPGLIPVSFIEVRDTQSGKPVDDPLRAVQAAGVPKVEEWKRLAADYKNSSISLGKFEVNGAGAGGLQKSMERLSLNGNQAQPYQNGSQPPYNGPSQGQQSQSQLLAPIKASIPRYCFENDKYWYIIECVMEDGSHWELSRFYQNFYDFQIALLQQFPVEAATDGGNRILPYMPGPVTYVTDAISNGRRESLDYYVKQLLQLPPYISKCQLVRALFAPREGDFELDPKAMEEDYRLSRASQHSSSAANSHSLSRQSSHTRLNGYSNQQQPRYAQSQPGPYNNQAMGSMQRQMSSLTQASTASGPGTSGSPNPPSVSTTGALKIKVWFEDDCIAIRVPAEISFGQLRDKLHERLKINEEILIQYKDEPTNGYAELLSDNDLRLALERNAKLQLYVGYA